MHKCIHYDCQEDSPTICQWLICHHLHEYPAAYVPSDTVVRSYKQLTTLLVWMRWRVLSLWSTCNLPPCSLALWKRKSITRSWDTLLISLERRFRRDWLDDLHGCNYSRPPCWCTSTVQAETPRIFCWHVSIRRDREVWKMSSMLERSAILHRVITAIILGASHSGWNFYVDDNDDYPVLSLLFYCT